jgi:hypothetical protein
LERVQSDTEERPLLAVTVQTGGAKDPFHVGIEKLPQRAPFRERTDGHSELAHGQRCTHAHAEEGGQTGVGAFPLLG